MLIRAAQIKAFESDLLRRFENELIEHSRSFSPKLCGILDEDELRLVVRNAIAKAKIYGFNYRGTIRLFLEFSFLFGSSFDTDPQYWRITAPLREPGDQMERAGVMHRQQLEYLNLVSGPGNRNVHQALEHLHVFATTPGKISPSDPAPALLRELALSFPQKVAYAGEGAMNALVREGVAEALKHEFAATRQQVLLIVFMFAFGHGCTGDPLYPWIERTLSDPRIAGPDARAERLEKKAVTWLEHVIAGNREERSA